ncbi:hypothetical protein [Caloranaerobacter azorensis]|uniref:hypothetical protein n=1 Tax=Caloranaerobacter azorensis TaxID=116090 RepID=UPI0005540250|nr:hypothetical protein [Caloranaerobacter azorensis]
MSRESVLDLRYNISALVIAALRRDVYIPEQAFAIIAGKEYKFTDKDIEDMRALKESGLTYEEIGKIYGLSKDNVYAKLKRRKKKLVKN